MFLINIEQRSYLRPIRIKILKYILSDKRINWSLHLKEKFKSAYIKLHFFVLSVTLKYHYIVAYPES